MRSAAHTRFPHEWLGLTLGVGAADSLGLAEGDALIGMDGLALGASVGVEKGGRRSRNSRSASAVSMAATRLRSACATRLGSNVSCSPFRVPVARLAADQAAIATTETHNK